MIENPSNLTEQLLNFVERIAQEMRAIYNKVMSAAFSVNNIKPDSEGNVYIDSIENATKAEQDKSGNVITTHYLSKQEASSTYTTKEETSSKAPINHSSTDTKYGVGSQDKYGHIKLSDSISSSDATSGIAATPKAVKLANDLANLANEAAAIAQTSANEAQNTADSATTLANKGIVNAAKAQEAANQAQSTADAALPKEGGEIVGNLVITGTLTIK